jgi:hypothetical protein
VPVVSIASGSALSRQVAEARRRLADGERLVFHVMTESDGAAIDVRVRELSAVHLYVPDTQGVPDGARGLVAKTLGVEPSSFDVVPER